MKKVVDYLPRMADKGWTGSEVLPEETKEMTMTDTNALSLAGLTDQQIAETLGVSRSTVNRRRHSDLAGLTAAYTEAARANGDKLAAMLKAPAEQVACPTTVVPAALATGLPGKDTVHSRRSLEAQKGKTKPSAAINDAPAGAAGIINRAGRVVLKGNKEVRAALKAAAKAKGGNRLIPDNFESFSAFLNGFAAETDTATRVTFTVPGGQSVILTIGVDGSWTVA